MKPLYDWIGGRSTTFAWFCIIAATGLAGCNRLTPAYAAVITAISGFVVWRAKGQDSCPNVSSSSAR